jgi:hypothetical protein
MVEKKKVTAKKKRVGNKEGRRDKHFAIITCTWHIPINLLLLYANIYIINMLEHKF